LPFKKLLRSVAPLYFLIYVRAETLGAGRIRNGGKIRYPATLKTCKERIEKIRRTRKGEFEMARKQDARSIYEVAQLFRQRCFGTGDSLLWPGKSVWTLENIERLSATLADFEPGRPFYEQWRDRLSTESDDLHRLASDLVAFYGLFPRNIARQRKFKSLKTVVGWKLSGEPLEVASLEPAFSLSIGTTSRLYFAKISQQIAFFLAFAKESATQKTDLLDAASSKALAAEVSKTIPYSSAGRNVLLHLLFPDAFEGIISQLHKKRIVRAFRELAGGATELDEALLVIRKALEEKYGKDFDFYQADLRSLWDAKPPKNTATEEAVLEESGAADSESRNG
jgi:hypothetical protein